MPNQHKTSSVCWHPSDPTLRSRIVAEARRRGMTLKQWLDETVGAQLAMLELRGKEIHHADGDRTNNDLGNLELREGPS